MLHFHLVKAMRPIFGKNLRFDEEGRKVRTLGNPGNSSFCRLTEKRNDILNQVLFGFLKVIGAGRFQKNRWPNSSTVP